MIGLEALALALALTAASPPDIPAPSVDEVRKVVAYYSGARDQGPLLLELGACLVLEPAKVASRSTCRTRVNGTVAKGSRVHVLAAWLVPDSARYEDVAIQFAHEGVVRAALPVPLVGPSWRTQAVRSLVLDRPGRWEIRVARGPRELGVASIVVQ